VTATDSPVPGVAARAVDVWKVYGSGEAQVSALRGVSVELERGAYTAIMGPSGSGKSTLMHCLAGLDSVTKGEVSIGDTKLTGLGDRALTNLRRDKVGFIFQQFNLLPTLTAEENILLPLSIAGRKPDKDWYNTVIDTVGLRDRLKHRPSQLSGGQQQRVACARALVARPEVIFADEPTGNLDSRSGAEVLGFLRQSVRSFGQTIVMVTHDPNAASYADRVVFLADGQIVDELRNPTPEAVLDKLKSLEVPSDEPAETLAVDEAEQAADAAAESTAPAEATGTAELAGATAEPAATAAESGDRTENG
jgi:putative ABC transport system ATP-binding protein